MQPEDASWHSSSTSLHPLQVRGLVCAQLVDPSRNDTLWLFNIAMENGPFIDGLPGVYLLKMVMFHGYVE
jgi:hypothetical protein